MGCRGENIEKKDIKHKFITIDMEINKYFFWHWWIQYFL